MFRNGQFGRSVMSALFVVALSVAACGGDDDGGASTFTGSWQFTSGTTTFTCGGQSFTDMLTGSWVISAGTDAPLVSVDGNCTTRMDVNGTVATMRSGQQCTDTEGGTTVVMTIQSGTFTVSSSTTATLSANGTATVSEGTASVSCTFSMTGGLMKVGK